MSTDTAADDAPVLFEERVAGNGTRIGIATLNAPRTLNGFSLPMANLLLKQLNAWADDDGIAMVVLQGAGEKAFCAGGDLHSLYKSMVAFRDAGRRDIRENDYAAEFFDVEYRVDYLIHTYAKPILCWGHGIVMGGGIGLLAGASHRVVTPQSRLAMPEIHIGLYPDVGGSWFLRRMPGRTGLFLALTAANFNASDALFVGQADHLVPHERKPNVLADIAAADWGNDAAANRALLSRLLIAAGEGAQAPASKLREHFDTINALMAGDDLLDIAARLNALQSEDAWLQGAAKAFAKGAPSSIALSFALWQRVPRMSLAEVFRLEYWASLGFCAHKDFAEGIRAVLVDKDRNPKWSPASLAEITPAFVEDHLRPRGEMAPELVGLV